MKWTITLGHEEEYECPSERGGVSCSCSEIRDELGTIGRGADGGPITVDENRMVPRPEWPKLMGTYVMPVCGGWDCLQ